MNGTVAASDGGSGPFFSLMKLIGGHRRPRDGSIVDVLSIVDEVGGMLSQGIGLLQNHVKGADAFQWDVSQQRQSGIVRWQDGSKVIDAEA